MFFLGGFVFDILTLGRIDRLYDLVVLCLHMTALTITIILYNIAEDTQWKTPFFDKYYDYFPLAIQFFFGALSSAYVIYFSRSVSLSKTISFFIILVLFLFANEFLKKRIANKYLQFSVYFFVSFIFFTFMIPVFVKEMNTNIFLISGAISFLFSFILIITIYSVCKSTRSDIRLWKMLSIILVMYGVINLFYFLRLIPPVPLALQNGLVAHNITVTNDAYYVQFETDEWYVFWRDHKVKFRYTPGQNIYIFTSIFAPTDITKSIYHRWKYYNKNTNTWDILEKIGYDITGGRDSGYRGYSFKSNMKLGRWKVEVITDEELILGVINFEVVENTSSIPLKTVTKTF